MPFKDIEAKRAAGRRYWHSHPEKVADHAARKVLRKEKVRVWYQEFKRNLGCSRCPERHPACLTFHHLGGKDMDVSRMVQEGYSIKTILLEISKCVVLCANCHAKEHWGDSCG